jgi:hypothetical protein
MIAHAQMKPSMPAVQLMTVTPGMAANWLEHANTHNRPVSDAYVERLARDMRNGHWVLTHEGIAFDPNGVLLDGQNRLWAVIQADVPVRMHVWFNVTPEALMVINCGKPRSLADNLRLAGCCGDVDKSDLATLRAMLGRGGNVSMTSSEAAAHWARHRDAVAFAAKHMPYVDGVRGISTAEVRAVAARAYYSADRRRLEEFCRVLRTSIARGDQDRAAILLRNHLTSTAGSSRLARIERYRKTQRALKAFLRGQELTKLYAGEEELFPLPEDATN